MEITKEKRADMLFLNLQGRLDNNNAESLEDSLVKLVEEGARQLIIDCSQVEYINNAGLRVLLNVAKRVINMNGRVALHSLSQAAKDIFDKTGFSMVARVYDTREEAIAGVAGSGLLSSLSREGARKGNK
ncbi:MAG: STAS domain-containing protein [Blastocatellia bacterium]